jgi:hypothetical protein
MAANECGDKTRCQIGPKAIFAIFAMDLANVSILVPGLLDSTGRPVIAPLTLNDLATDCPKTPAITYVGPQAHWELAKAASSYTMDRENRCNPQLAIPMDIKRYGYPYWKHCNFFGNKFGWFDPPGAVPTVAGILPTLATTTTARSKETETSLEAIPSAATSMPGITRVSLTAELTGAASNTPERPNADAGIAATEESHPSTSPSSPRGQEAQDSDSNANADAVVIPESMSKSGTTRSVIAGAASPSTRPSEETNQAASSANAAVHQDGDSDPKDQPVTKVQDEEHKPSASALAQNDDNNPEDQPVVTKLLITTSQTTRPAEGTNPTAPSANAVAQKGNDNDSDLKDQTVTKVQDDDDDFNTSNGAARILPSIFHGISQNNAPAKGAPTSAPNGVHSATDVLDTNSKTFDSPTTDGAKEDSVGHKFPGAASSQSIGKTDGDDGDDDDDDDDRGLAVQVALAGIAAASLASSPKVSGSPAFADGKSSDAHAVSEDDSAHISPTKTNAGPVEMMVTGHAASNNVEVQHADVDLTGDPEAKHGGGEFDFVAAVASTSIAAGDSEDSRSGKQDSGSDKDKAAADDHGASADPSKTGVESMGSASEVVVVDGVRLTASYTADGNSDGTSDAHNKIEVVGGDENSSVDRAKDRHTDDSIQSSAIIAIGAAHDKADGLVGTVPNDASDSYSSTAPAASDSDSDRAESESAASSTKNSDVASTTTTSNKSTVPVFIGNSASAEESPEEATGAATESPPTPTRSSSNPSLSSANAEASPVPNSQGENSGTRPGSRSLRCMLAALGAIVLYIL